MVSEQQSPAARLALQARPLLARPAGMAVAVVLGLALGLAAVNLPAAHLPEASLRLAALLVAALPLLLLADLSTPPLWQVRSWMGESGPAAVAQACRDLVPSLVMGQVAAVVAGAVLAGGGGSRGDALILAGVLAVSAAATVGLAGGAILLALRVVAAGGNAAWSAVSGGANFGPQATAPLLYAPGLGWVAGLVPAAVLSAVWSARPALLTADVLVAVDLVVLFLAKWLLRQAEMQLAPAATRALQQTADAHALPFAVAQVVPESPAWLGARSSWVALVYARWHAAPWLGPLVLAAALGLGLPAVPNPWALAVLLVFAAAWSPLRALTHAEEVEDQTAQWLGAAPRQLAHERQMLATRLAPGSLLLTGVWLVVDVSPAVWLAIVLGSLTGWWLCGSGPSRRWLPTAALGLTLAMLAIQPLLTGPVGPVSSLSAPVSPP